MRKNRKKIYAALCFLCSIVILYAFSGAILSSIGEFLVVDDNPSGSEAAVVLNAGMEYYPRLIEAATLYNRGYVKKIVINGNRKTNVLRKLEKKGLKYCCPWYEERVRILELYNIPRADIVTISAEDVYDTISEAEAVGKKLIEHGILKIVLVTSKSHTRRARHIWRNAFGSKIEIKMVSAKEDPYDPAAWWKSGRQIKWVLSEYGAWVYYYYNRVIDD